jgi:Zn-dependent protease/CBS domain-containing protein
MPPLSPVLGSGGSLRLARIFGIRIGVNLSWFVVLFLFIFWFQQQFTDILGDQTLGFLTAVLTSLGFFGSILLHELGHALAARREGITVTGIDLFLFGGVMKMSQDTRTPGQEFRVSAAGPLVTLLVAAVLSGVGVLVMGGSAFVDGALLRGTAPSDVFELWLSFLVSMNVLLLVFNLVPAFPLDGGRIARSVAWRVTGDRTRATRFAAFLGQLFAAALIGYGLYQLVSSNDAFGGLWYVALGWMLGGGARAAIAQSAFTDRLRGVTVADIMDAEPVTIPADLPATRAWEEFFLRYHGWPWFAVVEPDGRFTGIAHRAAVEDVAYEDAGELPVRVAAVPADAEGQVQADASLETLMGSEPLYRLGALMAVDAEGRLRGVVTPEQLSSAVRARLAAT